MLKMLEEAEKLSKVAADYKATSKFNKGDLSPQLTPEILFGMTLEEKASKFEEIVGQMDAELKDHQAKAKKCLDGSKAVKKPAEVQKLRELAS